MGKIIENKAAPAQIALPRLLEPTIVPIPGTRSWNSLDENLGAIAVKLTLLGAQLVFNVGFLRAVGDFELRTR
jgi:hypothetical protein